MKDIIELDGRRGYTSAAVIRLLDIKNIKLSRWIERYSRQTGRRVPIFYNPEYRHAPLYDVAIIDDIVSKQRVLSAPPPRQPAKAPPAPVALWRRKTIGVDGQRCVTLSVVAQAIGVSGEEMLAWLKKPELRPHVRLLEVKVCGFNHVRLIVADSAAKFIAAYRRREMKLPKKAKQA